ncbi:MULTISPECIES: DGQHR domain-containing protein DpdB [Stenotrophomonas]|uniref:DGQHR domain-containing protein DpdB n=1 Tax=Stenotrophomonas maltophilia group TaxID=995085 RepID=UPI00065A2EB8|nr:MULTISPECIES: DGQHR domain-containing protein DpdB [Stenotrophomonas]CRQ89900.1 DGQHR domain protein [Pseudomonas aeruginosa]MBH1720133.1 DGQHR domain-containing protein [Stenotrophomonas maltophilia]MBH1794042.1 DGQHR domain-containing protein [Stenotrophomonas maltophilia]MDH2064152.1 DGQHR domain-containing protein DpdB [Stenotrophomonas maltophilia]HEL3010604.1 DGQHR domain-containing protein [Stenotrophomonas maltophilia]
MTKKLTFNAIAPQQSPDSQVAFFVATAQQIDQIASINRLARDENGLPTGFQRPQIAKHIREIGDYLARPDAILANPIVLGFVAGTGANIKTAKDGSKQLIVDISKGVPGQIVDGQQRFSALREIGRADFQVPVSAFICSSHEELTQQFILINNTKPLNKGMIYELLPIANRSGMPFRLDSRRDASSLVATLNFGRSSSLKGMIRGQTTPHGVIQDTVMQKLIMNSMSDGALRMYRNDQKLMQTKGADLISEYFHAVSHVFHDAWKDHTPTTSRLIHSVGITAMGFVMEYLHSAIGATKREDFIQPLTALRSVTAWTEGEWVFGPETRRWNGLQKVSADWKLLSFYLVQKVRESLEAPNGVPAHVRG